MIVELTHEEAAMVADSLRKAAVGSPDAGLAYVLASRIEGLRMAAGLAARAGAWTPSPDPDVPPAASRAQLDAWRFGAGGRGS
jgi:hypothetical protein